MARADNPHDIAGGADTRPDPCVRYSGGGANALIMIQNQIYRYFERNEGRHVLFIFDPMDDIGAELRDAEWEDGYRYVIFDGRWFTLKYNIHNAWKKEKVILLFPPESQIVYPETEEQRLAFPLLGELEAGGVMHGENVLDFMTQHQIDAKHKSYVSERIHELSIGRVEAMLAPYYQKHEFTPEIANRAILSHTIDSDKLLEWNEIILRVLLLGCSGDKKRRDTVFNRLSKRPAVNSVLKCKLTEVFGISYNEISSETRVEQLVRVWKYNLICRSLTPKDEDDYQALKVKDALAVERMFVLHTLACAVPATREKYETLMRELGADVRESRILDCYGLDAPYSYVPQNMCLSMVERTVQEGISKHAETVAGRMESVAMRQPGNELVEQVTAFVSLVAGYYEIAARVNTRLKIDRADEFVSQYTETFYQLDTLYRKALERYYGLLNRGLAIIDSLTQAKQQLDVDYHELTGSMGLEWSQAVRREGRSWNFETVRTRQADFYDKYVRNVGVRLMVIVSDGLRYEVARELLDQMYRRSKQAHRMHADCMIGILPSETKYSKLALLPHRDISRIAEGASLDGGPYLADMKSREAHLRRYKSESCCFNFADLQGDSATNRELLKGYKLVYVFHDVIDAAGHNDDGASLVTACRRAVDELSEFVLRSLASYNFERVIVTGDHGFLFNDLTIQEKDKQTIDEESSERKSRYYLTHSAEEVVNVIKYDGVAVPAGTNRFAVQGGTYRYAHGGASLQETVIPLILASRSRDRIADQKKVQIMLLNDKLVIESSQLQLTFIQKEAVSYDTRKMRIRFALYEADRMVSEEKLLDIDRADADATSRIYNQSLTLAPGVSASLLELRIYDTDDSLNPILKETVMNRTLVERDF